MKYVKWYFRQVFSLDLRALALLRIGLGAILLLDLGIRATDLEAHYSNQGVLPLHFLYQYYWNPFNISFHTLSGLWQVQALLFAAGAAGAFCLMVGYRTRLATIFCWFFLLSLHNRNPLILQGGDDLLRMLLFWCMFLPLNRFYSIDSGTLPKPEKVSWCSAATAAYVAQIALLYVFTALLKNSPEWHTDGTALYYALSLDQILMPGGRLLYPHPALLKYLTLGTYYTELWLPLLLFIPFGAKYLRQLVIGVLVLFHLGISLTLYVGLFFLINWVSVLALLPENAMNKLHRLMLRFLVRLRRYFRRRIPQLQNPAWLKPASSKPHKPHYLFANTRQAVVAFLLLYVCWGNLDSVGINKIPEEARWMGSLLRINQNWGMFAPTVFKDDGWYILEGTTAQGKQLDLNREGEEVVAAKPATVVSLFKNDRWRKFSENYLFVSNGVVRPFYCQYLLRTWNSAHPEAQVKTLKVVYMKEVSQPNYIVPEPTREELCICEANSF